MLIRKTLDVRTAGRGTVEITHSVQALIEQSSIDDGICNLFLKHTSASLILCENADPSVRRDVETFFANLVPDGNAQFTHTAEGPDDMSAHLRSILTQNSLSIPIANHRLAVLQALQKSFSLRHFDINLFCCVGCFDIFFYVCLALLSVCVTLLRVTCGLVIHD